MDESLTLRNTKRKIQLLGHIKARDVAMSDIRQDLDFGSRYTGLLVYSVKEQLRCFNHLSVCSIDDLGEDFKVIPQPPRREKRKGEYVSAYENQCLFGNETYGRYFVFNENERIFVGDHSLLSKTYKFYLVEIKEAEGRISPQLFWFIRQIGIKIRAVKGGREFNLSKDYIEDGDFSASIYDFVPYENIPLDVYIGTKQDVLDQYRAILNIIDAKIHKYKYSDRYDFTDKADSVRVVQKMPTVTQYFKNKKTMIDKIVEQYEDEVFVKADGFDEAIIGVNQADMRLMYSVKKCIEILCRDMNEEDAIEHFDYNVRGGYIGEKTPIWCEDRFDL